MAIDWEQYAVNATPDSGIANVPSGGANIDWEQYAVQPSQGAQAPAQPQAPAQQPVDYSKLPWQVRMMLNLMPSMMKPMKEAVPERTAALGRGFMDVGEGLKQVGLEAGEKMGLVTPGTAEDYTKKVDAERKFWESTPAGQDYIGKGIRLAAGSAPLMAVAAPLGVESMIGRLLAGGATGAGLEGVSYVPEGEDRGWNMVKGATLGAGAYALPSLINKAVDLTKGTAGAVRSLFPTRALERNIGQAGQEVEAATQGLQGAQAASTEATGMSNPAKMQYARNKAQQELSAMPEAQSAPASIQQAGVTPEIAQQRLEQAVNNHQNAQQVLNSLEGDLGKHLNLGAAHDVRTAAAIDKRVGDIENYWSQGYKALDQKLKNARFDMPPSVGEQSLEQKIADKINAYKQQGKTITAQDLQDFATKEQHPELAELLRKAPTSADTSASDFLAKYRSFRDGLYDLRQMAKTTKDAVERKRLFEAASQASDVEKVIKETLEKGLGQHADEFKWLNEGWSNQVIPLRQNKIVRSARQGKLSKNIVEQLRGTEPGTPLVRELVKQDPELLRNVVGQRFAVKPEEVYNPNELMQEYVNQMPELQKMVGQRQKAVSGLESAAQARKEAETGIKAASEQQKLMQKQQMQAEKEASRRAELQNQVELLDKHMANIQKEAQRKDISLKRKMELESELAKIRRTRSKIGKSVLYGGGGLTVYTGLKKAGNALSAINENSPGEQ